MNVHTLGAAGEVTGSAYLVETSAARVLVDFGLFQGRRSAERLNLVPEQLMGRLPMAVLLTHAHLDHTGRLPLLALAGYRGPIYGTPATIALTKLILRDAAQVQASDADRANRHLREGEPPVVPLFDRRAVAALDSLYRPVEYGHPLELAGGVRAVFVDAGHILGSASIEIKATENGATRTIVFSGDLGQRDAPILHDPVPFHQADLVLMESTYGDRNHRSLAESVAEVEGVLRRAVGCKGRVLVPTFAIGRTQTLLYCIAGAFHRKAVPPFPVYLDSPMAIEATEIYRKHVELFDVEALSLMASGFLEKNLENVHLSQTVEDSKALNDVPGPCVIMAGSGMCNAGRIVHHLRHGLANPDTTVLIVGYQSNGSLGRQLVDRKPRVRVLGREIDVRAHIQTVGGFSAHAGQSDLLHWFGTLAPSKPRVALTHGEDSARNVLARVIGEKYGLHVLLPQHGAKIEL